MPCLALIPHGLNMEMLVWPQHFREKHSWEITSSRTFCGSTRPSSRVSRSIDIQHGPPRPTEWAGYGTGTNYNLVVWRVEAIGPPTSVGSHFEHFKAVLKPLLAEYSGGSQHALLYTSCSIWMRFDSFLEISIHCMMVFMVSLASSPLLWCKYAPSILLTHDTCNVPRAHNVPWLVYSLWLFPVPNIRPETSLVPGNVEHNASAECHSNKLNKSLLHLPHLVASLRLQ